MNLRNLNHRTAARSCLALVLFAVVVVATAHSYAEDCPTDAQPIATDRPGVTNGSTVVPFGSLQAENALSWIVQHGSNLLAAPQTRLRLGIANCTEAVIDTPNYVYKLNGSQPSGGSDVVVSFKRQLPNFLGFTASAVAGSAFPSGSDQISGKGYQPYIQFPWSHDLTENGDWEAVGMFSVTWFPSESERNPTFEPTFSIERNFGQTAELFAEYAGDYDHKQPAQLIDGGGTWKVTPLQQLDIEFGMGLNRATVDHFVGIGYSFRLDNLFH